MCACVCLCVCVCVYVCACVHVWHLQEREAEYEEKQMLLKKGKEKEVARLRALQERDKDHKADQVCFSLPRGSLHSTKKEWTDNVFQNDEDVHKPTHKLKLAFFIK